MTKLGFLSFGHWQDVEGSRTRTGADVLLQAVELAVAAEEVGVDGAFFRVHHFARQHASPWPLLAAAAARTSTIELGTGVIDMRYENPLAMAELAAQADLISAGRLQLGISRGSPETVIDGWRAFGHEPTAGESDADMARAHTDKFRRAIAGEGFASGNPRMIGTSALQPIQPQAPGLSERIWWGAGTRATAIWTAEQGMNLMSSTLLTEDTGVPFDELQAEQIAMFRDAWASAGHDRAPRVSVSRSILPIIDDETEYYFGVQGQVEQRDQVGMLGGSRSRFGRSYIGAPDLIAAELARDAAVQAADTLLVTVPNQLGVEFNTRILEALVKHVMPVVDAESAPSVA
ncbi:LLM class flavin-dependent oxidoreductase [Salinibacterium sp. SWN248]|uniref:LLM class flavin-dependent oxidoreductase n=1 Tax=Salinibacterium sp. SWN248 TaxID=2792056 RepID=UPI0018CF42EF|nr:LLM class flavin-dependent oxidoreductase [Salinibacterium sp. SWN248]MBH0024631.1 LLM class flavin-dependent oxidoreductase [Salinibacterium sp. SWN248]